MKKKLIKTVIVVAFGFASFNAKAQSIEFREYETRNCGNSVSIVDYKVYKDGDRYSTISVVSYNGYWSTSCPNGGFLPDKVEQSRMSLKQFLIRQYESGTSNADSYTLTTK